MAKPLRGDLADSSVSFAQMASFWKEKATGSLAGKILANAVELLGVGNLDDIPEDVSDQASEWLKILVTTYAPGKFGSWLDNTDKSAETAACVALKAASKTFLARDAAKLVAFAKLAGLDDTKLRALRLVSPGITYYEAANYYSGSGLVLETKPTFAAATGDYFSVIYAPTAGTGMIRPPTSDFDVKVINWTLL